MGSFRGCGTPRDCAATYSASGSRYAIGPFSTLDPLIVLDTQKISRKYQQEWQSHGILPSRKGPGFGRCKYCSTDINIAHGGVYDVKKHLSSSKHQEMFKAVGSSRNVREFFQQSPIEQGVTRAEVLFFNFVAEHNLPFLTADHFTHLTYSMFPDSKIAQAFSCAQTKTTCIVKGALHPHFAEAVIGLCKESPFSILCDESSDVDNKYLAILITFVG